MEYNLETVTESFEKYKYLRFPLKIWILVNATGNYFLHWDKTKTVVVVDRSALERYLESPGSIFRCTKLSTFFWLMDFHGFLPVLDNPVNVEDDAEEQQDPHFLQYKNPSFTGDNRAYFEQLLRSRKSREVLSQQAGNCSVQQPSILARQKPPGESGGRSSLAAIPLLSGSFAQEKFDLLMEMKSLEMSIREAYGSLNAEEDGLMPIIEVPAGYCDEPTDCVPEYVKQRVLAGNYGDVGVDELKRFFGNFRPVFEDSPEALIEVENTFEVEEIILETASPEPVNTLETFDYQQDENEGVGVEKENREEPEDQLGSESKEGKSILLNGEIMMSSACKDDTKSEEQQLDESQFQLCSDIRETFDLLNEF